MRPQESLHLPGTGVLVAVTAVSGPRPGAFPFPRTSRSRIPAPPARPPQLLTGSSVRVQREPEQRESQQEGQDPHLGNHLSVPRVRPPAPSLEGSREKVRAEENGGAGAAEPTPREQSRGGSRAGDGQKGGDGSE